MSLINKMLQNLEERKDTPESSTSPEPVYEDLRPVKLRRMRARGRMGVVLLLLGGAGVGYYAWTQWGGGFFSALKSSAQAPQTPVAVAKPAKPKPARKPPSAPSVPTQPRLAVGKTQPATETSEPVSSPTGPTAENTSLAAAKDSKRAQPSEVPEKFPATTQTPARKAKQVATPAAPKQATKPATDYHIVVKGDSLYGIAARTEHHYEELAAWNNIDPPYIIYAGQRLRLSPPGQTSTSAEVKAVAASPAREGTASAVAQDDGGVKGSGVLEKKVTPLTVEQKAENDYRQAARYLQQGRPGDAEARLRSALAADPRHAKAREVLVGLTLRNGRWREAKQLLKQGIKKAPRHYPFVQLLARIHVEQGADGQALQLMEGAQQAARSDPEYMAFLATLYQRTGRHADAVKAFKHAIGLRPEAGRWWLGLGISLEAEKNWDEAIKAYTRARYSGSLTPKLVRYVERRIAVIKDK